MLSRKDIVTPDFYNTYINAVSEESVPEALQKNTRRFLKLLKQVPGKKINYAYAEGKWTIKELLQHVVDAERVFSFRALSFARKDPNALPGFDENTWAITAKAPKRKWNDLVDEFKALRAANEFFFASLDDDQLQQTGTANNNVINVVALGFICAGHVAHHMRIIKERYLGENKPVEIKVKKDKPTPKDKPKKKNKKQK
jgi:DinB superfamily